MKLLPHLDEAAAYEIGYWQQPMKFATGRVQGKYPQGKSNPRCLREKEMS